MFWSHVAVGAHHDTLSRQGSCRAVVRQMLVAGQAKVTNASLAGCINEYVGRLEVAMYDGRICSLQPDMQSIQMPSTAHADICLQPRSLFPLLCSVTDTCVHLTL